MIDDFLYKLNSNLYISNYLYQNVLEINRELIPKGFDLDKYNGEILNMLYQQNKDYFDNLFKDVDPNIHIDYEQAKTILADEDYSLIIAGAGTGKTTTMVAKVKYLVEKMHVNPSEIVVLSFTKKTTEKLRKIIVDDFDIPANVFTFHSLGYKYIRKFFTNIKQIDIVDHNTRHQIFLEYIKDIFADKEKLKNLVNIYTSQVEDRPWILGKFLAENYEKYNSFDEYFDAYKKNCLWESSENLRDRVEREIERRLNADIPITLKGEFVKSVGEAKIANFLYKNSIDYVYEKIYKELVDDDKEYKPDFTISYGGEYIYIEYFGLSNFEGEESKEYKRIKKIKEDYHAMKNNKLIKIDYIPGENIIDTLRDELCKFGIKFNEKSNYDIFNDILDQNPTREMFKLESFWYDVVDSIKSSYKREYKNYVINDFLCSLDINTRLKFEADSYFVRQFYSFYCHKLIDNPNILKIDFNDMIYYARKCLSEDPNKTLFNYKYIIIDEYQDISQGRYLLTKKIIDENSGKIMAVGDDWQSIYGFSGSKIEYIYDFEKYYKGAKTFKISTTYRNSQSLVNYVGEFIMRNKSQIQKELISVKDEENPIEFVEFDSGKEYIELKKIVLKIHETNPNNKILILARKNYSINKIFEDYDFKDDVGTKITIRNAANISIDGMSIHKSKGLTTDDVILIGLNNNFPIEKYGDYWLKDLFKNEVVIEKIDNAEERRVFYVALTRAKHKVYILVDKDNKRVSPFVQELREIIREQSGDMKSL